MRIVALLPSAVEIVIALGLGDELVAVGEGSVGPVDAGTLPILVHEGVLDEDALAALEPDLVIAPEARGQAGGPSGMVRALATVARRLGDEVSVMRLGPTSVEGVLNSIQAVGAMTEAEDAALFVVEGLRERLQAVEEIVVGRRDHGFQPPRVAALGGLEPPRTTGLWVPEQVRLAGGWELLGTEGGQPSVTTWSAIREVDPEVLVLMPRGLDLPGTVDAWTATRRPEGWSDLLAVRAGRVFAVDGTACFEHAGPRVIDGIEVLTELIDPVAFDGMAPPDSWRRLD